MDWFMVQVIFERRNLLHCISALFVTMNSTCPVDVPVSSGVFTSKMIVNQHTQPFMIVTQQGIGAGFTTHSQRFARGWKWQWQHCNGLKRVGMFRQSAVV